MHVTSMKLRNSTFWMSLDVTGRTIDLALMSRRGISVQSEKSKVGERHKLKRHYSYVCHLGTVSVRPNQTEYPTFFCKTMRHHNEDIERQP